MPDTCRNEETAGFPLLPFSVGTPRDNGRPAPTFRIGLRVYEHLTHKLSKKNGNTGRLWAKSFASVHSLAVLSNMASPKLYPTTSSQTAFNRVSAHGNPEQENLSYREGDNSESLDSFPEGGVKAWLTIAGA